MTRILRAMQDPSPLPTRDLLWSEMTPDERDDTLRQTIAQGQSLAVPAERHEVARSTISKWGAKRGIAIPAGGAHYDATAPWYSLSPEERDVACQRPVIRAEIAKDLGITVGVITAWRAQRGIKPPALPKPKNYKTRNGHDTLWGELDHDQRVAEATKLFGQGQPLAAVHKHFGCAYSALKQWCDRYDIQYPATTPQPAWRSKTLEEKLGLMQAAVFRHRGDVHGVAKELNLGLHGTREFARKHGFTVRSTPPPRALRRQTPAAPKPAPDKTPRAAQPKVQQPPANAKRHPLEKPGRVHILDSRSSQCKFPLWPDTAGIPLSQMFYCGDPTVDPGGNYCAHCRSLIRRGTTTGDSLMRIIKGTRRANFVS